MHHLAQLIGTDHDFSTFSLPHLSAYGVEPMSTRLGLVAARESPNAIDADLMSHEESIIRPVSRSFVIVCRIESLRQHRACPP